MSEDRPIHPRPARRPVAWLGPGPGAAAPASPFTARATEVPEPLPAASAPPRAAVRRKKPRPCATAPGAPRPQRARLRLVSMAASVPAPDARRGQRPRADRRHRGQRGRGAGAAHARSSSTPGTLFPAAGGLPLARRPRWPRRAACAGCPWARPSPLFPVGAAHRARVPDRAKARRRLRRGDPRRRGHRCAHIAGRRHRTGGAQQHHPPSRHLLPKGHTRRRVATPRSPSCARCRSPARYLTVAQAEAAAPGRKRAARPDPLPRLWGWRDQPAELLRLDPARMERVDRIAGSRQDR